MMFTYVPPNGSLLSVVPGKPFKLTFSCSFPGSVVKNAELPPGVGLDQLGVNPWTISGTLDATSNPIPISFRIGVGDLADQANYTIITVADNLIHCEGVRSRFESPPDGNYTDIFKFGCSTTLSQLLLGNFLVTFDFYVAYNVTTNVITVNPLSPRGLFFRYDNGTIQTGPNVVILSGTDIPVGYTNSFGIINDVDAVILYDLVIQNNVITGAQVRSNKTIAPVNDIGTNGSVVAIDGTIELSNQNQYSVNNLANRLTNRIQSNTDNDVPRILVESITSDSLGSNNGEYIFSIYDTIKHPNGYYCEPIVTQIGTSPIYQTRYVKYPQIQTVLKGNVCDNCDITTGTLQQKITYLRQLYNIQLDPLTYLQRLSFYAAVRYILSGFLYGTFDVKYLLEKYYKQFLIDLANSRFYKFTIFFTQIPEFSGYEKYFLCNIPGQCNDNNLVIKCRYT